MPHRVFCVLLLCAACAASLIRAAAAQSRPPSPDAAPRLAPGVLAEVTGQFGVVRVEDRDGLRVLSIDGVVQGGVPLGAGELHADPLVELLVGAMPSAKTALVIGLGSGRTATALAARVPHVDVIERDPIVVELARKHFGYRGRVEVAEGQDYLRKAERTWDLVVIDILAGEVTPDALVRSPLLSLLGMRRTERGVSALRLLARPSEQLVQAVDARFPHPAYHALFGNGVGDERQSVYLLASSRPIEAVPAPGLLLRPLKLATMKLPPPPGQTQIVTGYLVRMREDGSLILDVPHLEMGAVRFRLSGAAVGALAGRLPSGLSFPTNGDLNSDGSTTNTLRVVLGGGGSKRSDVRFSPIAAAVEGKVRFRSAVDPDAVMGGRYLARRAADEGMPAREPLLPYGGVLYDLEVSRILWTFDRTAWRRLDASLRPAILRAVAAVRTGKLSVGASEVSGCLAAVRAGLGAVADTVFLTRQIEQLSQSLAAEAAKQPKTAPAYAESCDQLMQKGLPSWEKEPAALRVLTDAFTECALSYYRKIGTRAAAERMITILQDNGRYKESRALELRWGL